MCAESKRFGTPKAEEIPAVQQSMRAGSYVPEGAFHADDGAQDASLRSKFMHASKKVCTYRHAVYAVYHGFLGSGYPAATSACVQGVAFVKTHGKSATVAVGQQLGKQATAAVGHIHSKIREGRTSPRSSQPSTPSFAEALSADHMSTAASTALPDFPETMDRTNSTSTRASEPLSPAERGVADSKADSLPEALPDGASELSLSLIHI